MTEIYTENGTIGMRGSVIMTEDQIANIPEPNNTPWEGMRCRLEMQPLPGEVIEKRYWRRAGWALLMVTAAVFYSILGAVIAG